jgi:hypothetical protein
MPNSSAIFTPTLFRGSPGVTQGAIRPLRLGFRPFSSSLRGKRQITLDYDRASTNAVPAYATVGVYGVELPYETADFGSAANGQRLPGFQPNTGSAGQPVQSGTYVERIKITGGAATGISFINVLDGGQDVSAAPTVVFTPATGAPAATAIIRDRRVVGIVVTAAGGPFTAPPVITFTGGGTMTVAPTAVCAIGQQVTINTHIPFSAQNALTVGGVYWVATWRDKIIAASLGAVAAFNNADDGAVDPDQHIMGTAANNGFTVATGTHPDGTPTIGVLTLALGLPNNEVITVYRGTIRELSTLATHFGDKTQIRGLDLVYAVVGGAGDNSVTNITCQPAAGLGGTG